MLCFGSDSFGQPLHGPLDLETGRRTSPVIRADELVQVEIGCNVNYDSLGINSRVLDGNIADATLQAPIAGSRSLDRFAPLSTFLVPVDSSSTSSFSVSSDHITQVSGPKLLI